RRDAITDEGLAHFQSAYPGEKLTKEDLFYYVYGLLHSPDYRERYADNLAKALDLCNPKALDSRFRGNDEREKFWRVEKMKVPKTKGEKDLTTLIYNSR